MTIRVVVADDHTIVRAGVTMLIEADADLEVVGQAESGAAAIGLCQELRPDVLILEVVLGEGSSFPTMMEIAKVAPETRLLVLTAKDEQTYWRSAVAVGASGYVVKRASPAELLAAIRAVHAGRSFISVSDSGRQFREFLGGSSTNEDGAARELSRREREVLILLAQGHTYGEVGKRLFISTKTVGTYRTRLAEKLGLRNRAEIVRYAIEVGLLA
ncbi:MAG: response regulator transcription factor [Myxococcota bacterium]